MTAARVRDAVILSGRELYDTAAALDTARRTYRREGRPANPAWEHLARLLDVSAWPPADTPARASSEPERMTTRDAATLLGYSERTVRRMAAQLDGIRLSGRWYVSAPAVREHLAGQAHLERTP